MTEARFVDLAMSIGVATKIAALIADCDKVMTDLPDDGDRRWYWRVESQRRLLMRPTLRAVVALTTRLIEETPSLGPGLAPAFAQLVSEHPELAPFHKRVLNPARAHSMIANGFAR